MSRAPSAGIKSHPVLGVVEWLRPGEYRHVEEVLADLKALGVKELRFQFSWADWHTPEGQIWYDWLLPYLATQINILPCFMYTPPSLGRLPKTSSPPRDTKAYADFIDLIITRLGDYFEWIELWNEPNNLNDWDWRIDPSWQLFADMIGKAAYWARRRGKKTVLGGMSPMDPNWLDLMCRQGALAHIDALGIHGFPGIWSFSWEGWPSIIEQARRVLKRHGLKPEIWITEGGYSTWRHDEVQQIHEFVELLQAPAERVYWYSGYDLHPDECHQDGFHEDERHYHFGLKYADGRPKLLFRIWQNEGLEGVRAVSELAYSAAAYLNRMPFSRQGDGMDAGTSQQKHFSGQQERLILITGGAGFVGTNLAHRLLASGQRVLIFDNLSRPGVEHNLRWLCDRHGDKLQVEMADIRDRHLVRDAVQRAGQIFHLAAQVAVTTSLEDPVSDFDVNARGTLNVLEAMRAAKHPPALVFTSTNKVYGALKSIQLRKSGLRYEPQAPEICRQGLDERAPLDFYSPYGCSKGVADQYVLDYARSYDLPAAVFRMSCIYGPHQFGTEDQGWVAHFLIQALQGRPITLYGDGLQVRDILFVDDLVEALLGAQENMDRLQGQAYNIGGGVDNAISLLELIDAIGELQGERPDLAFAPWRTGDQKYYVSDTRKFAAATGWSPRVSLHEGIALLHEWLQEAQRKAKPAMPRLSTCT